MQKAKSPCAISACCGPCFFPYSGDSYEQVDDLLDPYLLVGSMALFI
jgi:hypothetical protein